MKLHSTLVNIITALVLVFVATAFADPPIVQNVVISARTDGSGLVDVNYDVSDTDGDQVAITLQISKNGGATWDFPVLNAVGDLGTSISLGEGKHIVWDIGAASDEIVGNTFLARILASDSGIEFLAHSPRHMAIVDLEAPNWSDPAIIEQYSRADVLIVMGYHLWMGGNWAQVDAIDQLKMLNPDIVVLAYVSAKSAQLDGLLQRPSSFWYKWYERTEPYFQLTTTGAMAQDWPNSRIINILEPGCRQAQIETIVEMERGSQNHFDGVYWDYFNRALWIPDFMEISGDPDLDGDLVGHRDDPDEMQAYRDAQVLLVHALRDSLGEDFIQVFNGQRAYSDPEFAALADGAMYELFPTLFFPDPDMAYALDPDYQYSLFNVRSYFRDRNGGPFLVLANPWLNRYVDFEGQVTDLDLGNIFRAVSLVADCYSSWNVGTYGFGWPDQSISLGQPTGPPVFSGVFIRRDFEYGNVEIEMGSGYYPDAFDYRINLLGDLAEELAVPFHYP